MAFYILLLCFATVSSFCVSFSKDKSTIVVSKVITFMIMFVPLAIRYNVGNDYIPYVNFFNQIANGSELYKNSEPSYYYLNLLVANYGGSAQIVIAISGFVTLFFLFLKLDRKSWYIYIPVFMMTIYTWVQTTIRQMLAMSLVFCSYKLLKEKKWFFAILLYLLAFSFHVSTLLYIPIGICLYFLPLSKQKSIVFTSILFVLSVIYPNLILNIIIFFAKFTKYGFYFTSLDTKWVEAAVTSSGLGRILRYLVYFTLLLLLPDSKNKKTNSIRTLFVMYISLDFFSQSFLILIRVARGCMFVFLLIAQETIQIKKTEYFKTQGLRNIAYCICFFLLFFLDLWGGFNTGIPYQTIFSN